MTKSLGVSDQPSQEQGTDKTRFHLNEIYGKVSETGSQPTPSISVDRTWAPRLNASQQRTLAAKEANHLEQLLPN